MKQMITIPLDETLIQKARLIAVQHSMTLQHLLSQELTRLIEQLASENNDLSTQTMTIQTTNSENSLWPSAVRKLAGTWTDMPTIEEIRQPVDKDAPRETF